MKKMLLYLGLAVIVTGRLVAIDPEPYTLGVSFSFRISGVGNGIMVVYDGTNPRLDHSTYNATTESPMGTAWLKPGRLYRANFSASGPYEYWQSFTAPDGYQLFIDGAPSDLTYRNTGGGGYNYDCYLELRPTNRTNQASAGTFSGIDVGKSVSWEVGLGGIRNGNGAGVIYFKEFDLTNAPANRQRLYYVPPANYGQITVVTDGGAAQILRQIKTPQTLVDIVDLTGDPNAGYTFKFYEPSQGSWNGTTYTLSGLPWRTITVEKPGANQLKITETEGTISRISQLSLSGGPVGTNDYTWTLQEGITSPTSWARTTTYASINYPSASPKPYRELLVKVFNGNSTSDTDLAAKSKYRYESPGNWGEEVVKKYAYPLSSTADVDAHTTVYDYYTDDTARGNFRRLKSVTDSTGNWVGYIYYDLWDYRGTVLYELHPNESSPSTVTFNTVLGRVRAYSYLPDWTGRYRIPYCSFEYREGLLCGQSVNTPTINQSTLGQYFTRHQTDAYANASTYERSYSEVMDARSDNNPDYQGLIWSVKRPDLSQDSYAHYQGTYNPTTKAFTYGWYDPMYFRTIVWHGSSDSSVGTQFTGYEGISITPVYLIANKSTMDVTIRNPAGLVLRTETHVYTGGSSFSLMRWEDFSYDDYGRPDESFANDRAMMNYTFTNGLLTSTVDPSGTETHFTHDEIGRVTCQAKLGANGLSVESITHAAQDPIYTYFDYDGANRVRETIVSAASTKPTTPGDLDLVTKISYYLTGQVKEQVQFHGSANSLTTGYIYSAGGRIVTTAVPGGSTKITEVHLDGQIKSVTGTGVVHEYATYSLKSNPVQREQVTRPVSTTYGATTTTTFDWLGRPLTIVRPAWSSGTMTQTNYYNDRGQLWKVTRPGLAPTLYTYDTMGVLFREGLDVTSSYDTLVDASDDRITEHHWEFASSSGWWRRNTTKTYASEGSVTVTTLGKVETKLSELGTDVASLVKTYDVFGNVTTQTVVIERDDKMVTTTTDVPDSTMDIRQIAHNGRIVESRDQADIKFRYKFDVLGRQILVIDPRTAGSGTPLGTVTVYQSKSNFVESIIDPAAQTQATYTYDTAGRVASVTDVNDNVVYYGYNERGQKNREWGGATYPAEFVYDDQGRLYQQKTYASSSEDFTQSWPETPGTAQVTTWNYDTPTGLLANKEDAAGKKVEYTYTIAGQIHTRAWARILEGTTHVMTTYGYSATTGELLTVSYNDDTPDLAYTYNRLGQSDTVIDRFGERTFTYNLDGTLELEQETLPNPQSNARLNYTYDTTGTGTKGRLIGFGLGSSSSTNAYQSQTYIYRNDGRLDYITSNAATYSPYTASYTYTANSHLIATTTVGSYTDTRTYDPSNNWIAQREAKWGSDPLAKFVYERDDQGRISHVTKTGKVFDIYDEAATKGLKTSYTYNERSELKSEISADLAGTPEPIYGRQDTDYSYDQLGNRMSFTHNDHTSTYTPDTRNRYSQRTIPGYIDVAGAMGATATVLTNGVTPDRNGRYLFKDFKANGTSAPRLIDSLIGVTPQAKSLNGVYTFNYQGQSVSTANVTGPNDTTVAVLEFGGTAACIGIDQADHGYTFLNGHTYHFGFWARVTSGDRDITLKMTDNINDGATSATHKIDTAWKWVTVAKTYSSVGNGPRLFYNWDGGGAAFQVYGAQVVDVTNLQYAGVLPGYSAGTPEVFDYDDDGNLTDDGRWKYTYDAENRLDSMETNTAAAAAGVTQELITFGYDYLNRRVVKYIEGGWNGSAYTTVTTWERYIYNGWNLIAAGDVNTSNNTIVIDRNYFWGLDLSGTMQGAGGVGGLLFVQEGNNTCLPAYDAMGNVHAMITAAAATIGGTIFAAGDIVAEYEYDAFGQNLRESGPYAAANPFRFATKYTDIESGLVYHNTRYYSPSLGRFITRDTISEQGGLNLYAYVSNRVPNAFDRLGMDAYLVAIGEKADGGIIWIEGDGMTGDDYMNAAFAAASRQTGSGPRYNDFGDELKAEHLVQVNIALDSLMGSLNAGALAAFADLSLSMNQGLYEGFNEAAIDYNNSQGGTYQPDSGDYRLIPSGYGPNSAALANGSDSKTGVGTSYLFEKGKRYLNVYDGKELDRGSVGYRIGDRISASERSKLTGWKLDLFDVSNPDKSKLSGKYDGIVFTQHGDLDNSTGFWRPKVADAFVKLAPDLQPFLGGGGWVCWDHCFGGASQQYLDSMRSAMKVESILVSSGPETGFKTYEGPFVFLGGTWIEKK